MSASASRSSAVCRAPPSIPATACSKPYEKPGPIAAPICATSRAGPSRSSRAVRDCWSVGGIAWDAALLAALQQESRYLLDEQRHPAGRSVTPSITSFGSAWRAASSPTMWRTCWRSNGES
jgi:hypothetical protein